MLMVFVLILSGFDSYARIYYVSSSYTGTTSNGNFTTPWKSLADVQSNQGVFIPGDVVSFKCDDVFSGTLTINKSGSLGNPITYNSYGTGAKPQFIGTGNTISYLIYLYNKNYIVFDGLEITDPTISSADRTIQSKIQRAFGFDGTSSYNIIKNCKLSLVGVGTYWVGPNNTMDHCDVGNLRMVVNNVGGNNDYGANPVVISSAYNKITNNYFHDCWANSYDYVYDGGAVEFYGNGSSNNFIGYNTFYDCNGVVENGSGNGGLIENNEFSYNKFINNGSLFYINNGGTYLVSVANMKFYNNVIVENAINRVFENYMGSMSTSVSNQGIVVFKNNVFELSTGVDVVRPSQWNSGQLIHENNVYKLSNSSYINYTINSNELTTSQTLWANTINANAVLWDLTPSSNSPLINFGQNVGLTSDFIGNPIISLPDAGVIEKQNSNQIAPLTLSVSNTNISCNGGSSNVTVSAKGGTSPYAGTGTFNVMAGTYNYTVTDDNGLTATSSITITEPNKINVNVQSGNINQNGGTTTITVNANGGTGTLSYKLNNGSFQTSNIFNNVAAGVYTITVKDQNNCTNNTNIIISQPAILTIGINSSIIACNGDSSIVTVNASGGVKPYIGTGTFKVIAGTYSYTVTDSNGITASSSITINQPASISVVVNSGIITNYSGTTSVTINPSGGTGQYNYSLNNGLFQTSNIFNNVSAGTYQINVKDGNGCIGNANIIIKQPTSPLQINISSNNIQCNGGTSTVTVSASGGTPPYAGTGIFNVGAGNYIFNVTDSNAVTVSSSVSIIEPDSIRISVNSNSITSSGGTTTLFINAIGGAGGYSYSINNSTFQSSNVFDNVIAANYTVSVKDMNGCIKYLQIKITEPVSIPLTLTLVSKKDVSCRRMSDGFIEVLAAGGTTPYLYSINNGIYTTNNKFYNLKAGTYTVKVKDATNLIIQITVIIYESKKRCYGKMIAGIEENTSINEVTPIIIYPNPSAHSFKIKINSDDESDILIEVLNSMGSNVYKMKSNTNKLVEFGTEFKPGIYFVKVTQGTNVHVQKIIKF